MPGQDVKNRRRLTKRPKRYRKAAAKLNKRKVGAAALQESTAEARDEFRKLDNWGVHAGTPNNVRGRVGNAVVWRTDQYELLSKGEITLFWEKAEKGTLALPWVRLQAKDGSGEPFTFVSVHLPTPWVADKATRDRLRNRIIEAMAPLGRWAAAGDWNDGHSLLLFRRIGGRQVARHGVDGIVAEGFKPRKKRAARVVTRGVIWKLSDHPLVLVRGTWR